MKMKDFIIGLEIMSKYIPQGKNSSYFFEAGHDIIYFTVDPKLISDDDRKILSDLGFRYDNEEESWYMNT